ncbi:MAG: hypothetical protein JRJ04_03810 [Deltaproteobacteria bacterium]|nr:hypothetical protein [Deltaproteobacteria bacterium]
MKLMRIFAVVIVLAVGTTFLGCGGGGTNVQQSTTTIGQELIDLDKAYKQGVITEKQYNEQKIKILKKR